jgi:hypothetical protein
MSRVVKILWNDRPTNRMISDELLFEDFGAQSGRMRPNGRIICRATPTYTELDLEGNGGFPPFDLLAKSNGGG